MIHITGIIHKTGAAVFDSSRKIFVIMLEEQFRYLPRALLFPVPEE